MLRVRDIMTPQVITLSGAASARSAAWSLHTAHVTGAPVRDRDGNLVGVISNTDLSALFRSGTDPDQIRVEEAMTREVWSVHPDDPAMAAVSLMVERGIHRVVVVRNPRKVEGIVTPMDVLRALTRGEDFGDDRQLTDGP